jgi:hypothetical protein
MAGSAAAVRPVIPPFGVEFTGSDGGCCRGPLGQLWCTPFEQVAPVRSFPSCRGQVSFPGLYYAATMDAHVGFESWLERPVDRTNREQGSWVVRPGVADGSR